MLFTRDSNGFCNKSKVNCAIATRALNASQFIGNTYNVVFVCTSVYVCVCEYVLITIDVCTLQMECKHLSFVRAKIQRRRPCCTKTRLAISSLPQRSIYLVRKLQAKCISGCNMASDKMKENPTHLWIAVCVG